LRNAGRVSGLIALTLVVGALHAQEKPDLASMSVDLDSRVAALRRSAVFGGLGQSARVAVGYRTDARLFSGRELGRSKRVRERHIDVFDQLRPPPGSVSARELGVEAKPPKIVSPPRK